MEITKVYPLDAVFDNLDDVPEDVNDVEVSGWPSPGAKLNKVIMKRVRGCVFKVAPNG